MPPTSAGAPTRLKTSSGASTTENWTRVHPKVIVLLAGTNNVGNTVSADGDEARVADVTRGIAAILAVIRTKAPAATIILTGIFPRNDNMAVMPTIDRINARIARLADGRTIRYLNINDKLADTDGRLYDGMMNARDRLHPTIKGYQVWADGLKPLFFELLGAPSTEDHAPPPTGDPAAGTGTTPGFDARSNHVRVF